MIRFKGSVLWFGLLPVFAGGAVRADITTAVRVARLTFAEGYVHIDRAENAAQSSAGDPALLNMPLIEGQTVVTGENSQAEVEFEDGSLARLTPNSSLVLAHLAVDGSGGSNTQLTLIKGLAYFELRSAQQVAYTIAAGSDRISPVENTTFRINLDEPPAAVAVLDGTALVERGGSYKVDLHAGESFRSDPNEPGRYLLTQEIAADSWDQWNEARDQMAADAASQNTAARNGFAGPQGYGWSDLDANGRWYDVGGQSEVWQPAGGDAADFDPYGNGSWVWYPGAGYIWASSYAWGWTPFRCGGWSYWNSFGWGWTPNSACGSFGFAGYGGYGYGGYSGRRGVTNVVLPPLHYIGHKPPITSRGGMHPIIPVHESSLDVRPGNGSPSGTRTIAGVVATPLNAGVASYTARGGSAVGSSLRRDYPVDRTTHVPVLGIQPGNAQGPRQGFVSGAVPSGQQPRGMAPVLPPGRVSNGRPSGPYSTRPGSYPTGAQSHSTMQGSPRAPQMAAPSRPSAPSAAPHVSAQAGGGVRK